MCVYVCMCVCTCVHVCVCMSTEMCSPPGDQGTQVGPPTPLSHPKLMRKQKAALRSVWEELGHSHILCVLVLTIAYLCRM